jgi:hypothetical protein
MDLQHCLHTGYTWSPLTYRLHWLHLEPTHLPSALATLGVHSPTVCTGYTWSPLTYRLHWLHLEPTPPTVCTGYTWSPLTSAALVGLLRASAHVLAAMVVTS